MVQPGFNRGAGRQEPVTISYSAAAFIWHGRVFFGLGFCRRFSVCTAIRSVHTTTNRPVRTAASRTGCTATNMCSNHRPVRSAVVGTDDLAARTTANLTVLTKTI